MRIWAGVFVFFALLFFVAAVLGLGGADVIAVLFLIGAAMADGFAFVGRKIDGLVDQLFPRAGPR